MLKVKKLFLVHFNLLIQYHIQSILLIKYTCGLCKMEIMLFLFPNKWNGSLNFEHFLFVSLP